MFEKLEHTITDLAARLGPLLGPAPTAWLVGRATSTHLGWPWPVAVVAALVIECLGLAATATALTLWNYNKDKRKSDPSAPVGLALALVGVYFVTATGLTVALDIAPALATYAPAIFPALSLTATGLLALRADHRRRLAAIEADKAERRAARQKRKRTGTKAARGPARRAARGPETAPAYAATSDDTKARAAAILAERPDVSGSELGRLLGRSERLGRKLKAELLPELAHTSGNGRGPQ